jgi:tetratricopeptide (TPR) repeat protein
VHFMTNSMKRYLILALILILNVSCRDKKPNYNPEAIELNNKACELMKNQMNDSALILLDKATSIDKTYYTAYGNKIEIYCQRKDYLKAIIEAENELKAKPDLAEAWTFTGLLYDWRGDTIKAKDYYQKSISLYDKRISNEDYKENLISNKLNRAVSLILLGNEKAGKDELKKLKELNPDEFNIDEFLKMSRQDYLRQSFDDK